MAKKMITKVASERYSRKSDEKKGNQVQIQKKDHSISKPVDKQWKEIAEKVLNENIGAWKTLAKE
jgi:hypothetical protein